MTRPLSPGSFIPPGIAETLEGGTMLPLGSRVSVDIEDLRLLCRGREDVLALAREWAEARRFRLSRPEVGDILEACTNDDLLDNGPCYSGGRYRSDLSRHGGPCPSCRARFMRHSDVVFAAARLRGIEARLVRALLGPEAREEG